MSHKKIPNSPKAPPPPPYPQDMDFPTDYLVKLAEAVAFAIDAGILREPHKLTWSIPITARLKPERRLVGTFTVRDGPEPAELPNPPGFIAATRSLEPDAD